MPDSHNVVHPAGRAARRGATVIFNPTAGPRRRRRLRAVLRALAPLGVVPVVCETVGAGDATRLARDTGGDATAIAAGGDGTINEIVNGLRARAASAETSRVPVLAVIPLGTANVLALELGLDARDPQAVAQAIAAGETRLASLGVANGRRFVVMAGVGFDARVVANVDVALKRRLGKAAYVLSSVLELARYRPRTYRVRIAGEVATVASLVVANGRHYGGRYRVARDASIDVPALHAVLFGRTGRWNALRYLWGLASGRLERFPDVRVVATDRLSVEAGALCGPREPVQGDGDVIGFLPVAISLERDALAIVRGV